MTSSSTTSATNNKQLPVIIVGAGPCGLLTGLALKQYGVPYVLIERASRTKICSNAGSGFELAPTSVEILQERMGIDIMKIINVYKGMKMGTIEGKEIREANIPPDYKGGSVNRAGMQNFLLEILFPTSADEEGILFCGSGIDSYIEDEKQGRVTAILASGLKIDGCVLLACDGIHSRCRAIMHGGYDSNQDWETNCAVGNEKDPLHYCNTMVYWGKTSAPKGSELEATFAKTQRVKGNEHEQVNVPIVGFPSIRAPSSLFIVPSGNGTMLNWAFTIYSKKQNFSKNNDGKDLTRRGGGPLTEEEKEIIFDFSSHGKKSKSVVRGVKDNPLVEQMIAATPAADITEAGLFDRKNLNLPFTSESKLVALLGDAAHPQTPFCGQGVNMAISDAYVYATNIALALNSKDKTLKEAISQCDTESRRKSSKYIVKLARTFCNIAVSQNPVMICFTYLYSRFAPDSEFLNQIIKTDKSNREFLKELDEERCTPEEQTAMRQKQATAIAQ